MESCDPRFENLPDGGSGVISRCSKPPNDGVVGAVRQDGIGHWQGESLTLLGKTCNNKAISARCVSKAQALDRPAIPLQQ